MPRRRPTKNAALLPANCVWWSFLDPTVPLGHCVVVPGTLDGLGHVVRVLTQVRFYPPLPTLSREKRTEPKVKGQEARAKGQSVCYCDGHARPRPWDANV